MQYISLASGSSGNCHIISHQHSHILLDAGLQGKSIQQALLSHGIDPAKLTAIVVSHEHIDHVKGVGILSRRFHLPVYATLSTWKAMDHRIGKIKEENRCYIQQGEGFCLEDLWVESFAVSHDAVEPSGFAFSDGRKKLVVVTDTGCVLDSIWQASLNADLLVLESNHDVQMLKMGPYSYALKRRVLSDHGHLSNEDAAIFASHLLEQGTQRFCLAHLSQHNNMPMLANQTFCAIMQSKGISEKDYQVEVLHRHQTSDKIIL